MSDARLEECMRVAVAHALRQPWIAGPQDQEERRSIAMTSAWEAATKSEPDRPAHELAAFVRRVVRSRLIDAVRSEHGEVKSGGVRCVRPRALALIEGMDRGETDVDEVVVADLIRWLAGGDRRTERVLSGIAAGERKQDIAAVVGVSPSRVSQIVASVRDGARARELVAA